MSFDLKKFFPADIETLANFMGLHQERYFQINLRL